MNFPTQPSLRFSHFEPVGLDTLPTIAAQLAFQCDTHWDHTLRPWLESQECGMPTPETLRNHGTWLIPHHSQQSGLDHKLFRWRGIIVFEGWFDAALGQHIIHPHTPTTPLPWQQEPKRWSRALPPPDSDKQPPTTANHGKPPQTCSE